MSKETPQNEKLPESLDTSKIGSQDIPIKAEEKVPKESSEEKLSTPEEEFLEEDLNTHVHGNKKPLKGKLWKSSISGEYVRYRDEECGTVYVPGDAVYIESQRSEQPYYVCAIQSLKMSKRDTLMVHVKWFYRTSEVPEQVYQLLVQDRHIEHGNKKYDVIHDPTTRKRELFISDATDIYPVSVLRGKCIVFHCSDIKSFRNFVAENDTFFYTLSYNPETRRLASTQGEIRVGASHQAKLPDLEVITDVSQRPTPKEELSWEPGQIHDHDLLMYLRAARSMAAFSAMCDGGSTEDGYLAASRDTVTANAIRVLHSVDYDKGKALQNLLEKPYPVDSLRSWYEEDVKDFIKGLKAYGKNFFKIKTEFLPRKETSELIEFYYLWKKSPGAANNRPRGRRHRPNVLRRIKNSKSSSGTTNGTSNRDKAVKDDPLDPSSASEPEIDEESEEMSLYYCRHCYTTSSKDWHHASKEKILLCHECRMYFKKYSELPILDPKKENEEEETPDVGNEPIKENESVDKEERTVETPSLSTAVKEEPPAIPSTNNVSRTEIKNEDTMISPINLIQPSKMEEIKPLLPLSTPSILPAPQNTPINLHQPHLQKNPPITPPKGNGSSILCGLFSPVNFKSDPDIQIVHQSAPPSPQSLVPSPPPKPDGSECHRTQSAIFIRTWNRGEYNSCSRTDMIFKPVPDSKLARKRDEKVKKSSSQDEHPVHHHHHPPPHSSSLQASRPPVSLPPGFAVANSESIQTPSMPPKIHHSLPPRNPVGPPIKFPSEFEQHQRRAAEQERKEDFLRLSMRLGSEHFDPRRNFGHSHIPPEPSARARLEELANRERQYTERMLATDPLVRLQMAGVNPEIPSPGSPHPLHPSGLLPPSLHGGLRGPSPHDMRFNPNDLMGLRYPPPHMPPGLHHPDVLRQMLMEREILAAHGALQHQSMLAAQQEELMRLEHEARARHGRP